MSQIQLTTGNNSGTGEWQRPRCPEAGDMLYRGRGPAGMILGICSPAPKTNVLVLEEHAHLLNEFGPKSVVRNDC